VNFAPGAKRIIAITTIALGLFWVVALMSQSVDDWPFESSASLFLVSNYSGPLGSMLAWLSVQLFGRLFAWLAPLYLVCAGLATLTGQLGVVIRWGFRAAVFVFLLNTFFALTPFTQAASSLRGSVGDTIAGAMSMALGGIGSTIVVVAILLLLILDGLGRLGATWPAIRAANGSGNKGGSGGPAEDRRSLRLPAGFARAGGALLARGARAAAGLVATGVEKLKTRPADPEIHGPQPVPEPAGSAHTADDFDTAPWKRPEPGGLADPLEINTPPAAPRRAARPAAKRTAAQKVSGDGSGKPLEKASLPPLSILEREPDVKGSYSHDTLKNWSGVLEEKLLNYGVEGRVSAVHHGPVVTTFEFEPATGVRIKDIVSRADDLALAMRARSLRMIAPIPGRAAVGIEIPNPESRIVYLRDILGEITEKQRFGGVMIGLGVDVVGKPYLMNLCDAPHLLIAGTTGSGKSVCLNTILSSILFQYRPTDVQILLVDPKMVEMSMYEGIPHLMHPVITEPKEAAKVLEYLTAEMTRRNSLFRRHGVKNIESYNTKVSLGKIDGVDETPERLPYIVLIVDELGDLALAKGVDIETLLARLAQMARAAGIHMVLATQRPSVDVIVGKTKANFPTRIAFRVATRVDSRTILDTIGADKLLGKGDMLYADARNPVPLRLHGAWVSEKNLEELIAHWKSYEYEESNLELQTAGGGAAGVDGDFDPLFDDAKGVILQYRQGSTSLLQRKLHVGYARAARLLDQLEQSGFVGPPDGSKPREVYIEMIEESLQ
jgi:S-DNA-T family DNA segregation ATPase FtsK/SpoIIIE